MFFFFQNDLHVFTNKTKQNKKNKNNLTYSKTMTEQLQYVP